MKTRKATIYNGRRFNVPQCIQRLDHLSTHGWQLRYGGTKMFSDGQDGAAVSLARATEELLDRIAKLPAPSLLQKQPNRTKTSDLPVGISGPIVRQRRGSTVRECYLGVSLPRFGAKRRHRNIYIGSERTYTTQRFEQALEKAITLRKNAEQVYRRDATMAKREEGKAMRAQQALRTPRLAREAGAKAPVRQSSAKSVAPQVRAKAVAREAGARAAAPKTGAKGVARKAGAKAVAPKAGAKKSAARNVKPATRAVRSARA